jgi:hypothetical protein
MRLLQAIADRSRQRENKRVMGGERLMSQMFDLPYLPACFGRRILCLSEKRSLRLEFLTFLNDSGRRLER